MSSLSTPASDDRDDADVGPGDLTAFQQNILAVLAEETRYGLAIKRALEDYYNAEVNHGRLYPNLDDLVEYGFVEKSELDKRTNQYAITDAGRAVIETRLEWIAARVLDEEEDHRLNDAEPATAADGPTGENGDPVLTEDDDA